MSARRRNVSFGLLALISIACCIGISLIAGAGISIAVAAWVGGAVLAALVLLAAAVVLLLARARPRRDAAAPSSILRGRS